MLVDTTCRKCDRPIRGVQDSTVIQGMTGLVIAVESKDGRWQHPWQCGIDYGPTNYVGRPGEWLLQEVEA